MRNPESYLQFGRKLNKGGTKLNKILKWKSFRWFAFLMLLFAFTGCAELNFFRWLSGDPDAPTPRGCSSTSSGPSRGCPMRTSSFEPVGYEGMMGHRPGASGINPRDMGFAQDVREYRPINPSRD